MPLSLREASRHNGRIIYLELLVLVLSIYSLVTLCLELLVPMEADTLRLLSTLDTLVCAVFLTDFAVHLWRAPSRLAYMKWGWLDLLSSIPTVEWLRWGRVFRVLRILRALRSFNFVAEHFAIDRARGTFGVVTITTVLAALIASVAVLHFERGAPGGNIHGAGDALWWSFATITTIGYGDHFPVTGAGRAVAVLLVICGLSIFGTFTAFVASFFIGRGQEREEVELHHVLAEVRALRGKIDQLEAGLRAQRGVPTGVPEGGSRPDAAPGNRPGGTGA